ncbi:MAG: TrkH family potassium uptake protein [Acidimicrobiia bacterium]|nr:TrkH family potassium uptake protein [Acidimicrobiia bacterium]
MRRDLVRRLFGSRASTPARLLVALFVGILAAGTISLMLPVATSAESNAPFMAALFTATSAVSVTGLIVVDTPTYWSGFGQVVILTLAQLGGLGIITLGSLAGLLVSRRIGLRGRRLAQIESGLELGDVRRVIYGVLTTAAVVELVLFALLTGAFLIRHEESFGRALVLGGFHAISAFNNAGFTLYSDNLAGFVSDPFVSGVIAIAVLLGGIGFPVLADLRNQPRRPRRWSLHTKLTLTVVGAILSVSTLMYLFFEWTNPDTLGGLDTRGKVLAAGFNTTMRTAGFSSIDFGALNETTQLATIISMFIGGGSGSAAGGIKVTTLALLVLAVYAEYRGDDVRAFGRRMPYGAVRQALAVALTSALALLVGTMLLLATGPFTLTDALFEATSAASIVGLSTGITSELNTAGEAILIVLMIMGRLGPLTVGTALILRERERLYRFPEERPIVG